MECMQQWRLKGATPRPEFAVPDSRAHSNSVQENRSQASEKKPELFPKMEFGIWRGRAPPQNYHKAFTAAVSSSFTSKTVYSFVICRRSCTFFVSLSSFSSPP